MKHKLPPCPICGKDDLIIDRDGRPSCRNCEVAVTLPSPVDLLTGTTQATRIAYSRGWDDGRALERDVVLDEVLAAYGPDLHDADHRIIESVRSGAVQPVPGQERLHATMCFEGDCPECAEAE